jgi:tetratricopeptide (TPR) repeat protein
LKILKLHSIIVLLFLFVVAATFSSCSTKRNTAMARGYHNLTSHYNVYWNGEQNLEQAEEFLRQKTKDNYGKVLRVYNYGDKNLARQMASRVEYTIKKAALAIQNHSMVFGRKEKIKWVQESYLMMGKAFFYKHDFTAARRVFDFVQKKYNYSPIHYFGTLWLAKTYIEMKQFGKAEAALNLLSSQLSKKDFPKEVKNTLPTVYADLYIAQGNTAAAYPYLEKSIPVTRDRDLLSRIYFIMGQINRQEGNLEQAGLYFSKVIKRNPPFQMDFEARLFLAKSYDAANGNSKYIMKTLEKMARKNQYQDFRDQIYFAMAEIAEKNRNDSLMVHYLKLSVRYSKKDAYQKSMSALKLANDYFRYGKYVPAQAYFDTAVQFLPKDYPGYARIKNKALVLGQLVEHLQTIRREDSLLRLAKMDTGALYTLIDKKIEAYRQEQAALKKEAEIKAENLAATGFSGGPGSHLPAPGPGAGGWYFYNPTALSQGFTEFRKRWGDRKLEDLWCLSDKHTTMAASGIVSENQMETGNTGRKKAVSKPAPTGPETRTYYLKGLPKSPADFRRADSLIIDSYNKLGFLYLEELHDTTDALKTYLTLQKQYPDNKFRLQNWYYLYKIFSGQGKNKEALRYKNLILQQAPESLYAKVLNNPDYYKRLQAGHNEAEALYSRTWQAFERQQYYRVITYANRALKKYAGDTVTLPQFMYLRALSLGKVDVPDTLYTALQELVKKYPHHPLAERAQDIIKMLQLEYGIGISEKERETLLAAQKRKKALGNYLYDRKATQYVMLLANRKAVNLRALKTRLSDFNVKYFSRMPLQINSLSLDNTNNLLLIKSFANADQAMRYYRKLLHDPYVFSGINKQNYRLFVISKANYPLFYKSKDVKIYREFFNESYLK